MKTAYMLSHGEYSDYRVCAVSLDEAAAKSWAQAINSQPGRHGDKIDVEEVILIEPGEQPKTVRRVMVMEEWWDNGKTENLRVLIEDEYPPVALFGQTPSRPAVRFVRAPMHANKGGRIEITARTRNDAMKVYSEQKAMWTAEPKAYRRQ